MHQEVTSNTKTTRLFHELRRADGMSAISRLSSAMAHALGTPLNVISGRAAMIASGELSSSECINNARIIGDQVARLSQLIQQMLAFSRHAKAPMQSCDVHAIVSQAITLMRPLAQARQVTLTLHEAHAQFVVQADPFRLLQIATTLLSRAIEMATSHSTLPVMIETTSIAKPPPHARLSSHYVRIILPEESSALTRDAFREVSEHSLLAEYVDEASALALSVSQSILREHGGWLALVDEPQHKQLHMILPLTAEAQHMRGGSKWPQDS
jgi:two-component system, NtrC family, sensor kinase